MHCGYASTMVSIAFLRERFNDHTQGAVHFSSATTNPCCICFSFITCCFSAMSCCEVYVKAMPMYPMLGSVNAVKDPRIHLPGRQECCVVYQANS